jgi:FG-GAP-like repeat
MDLEKTNKIKMYSFIPLLALVFMITVNSDASTFNTKRSINFPTISNVVAAGDLNNDGMPDLIVGRFPDSPSQGNISILLGKGNGNFQPGRKIIVGFDNGESSPFISDIEVADLNNDNNLDVVVSHNSDFTALSSSRLFITILFGNGDGTFLSAQPYYFAFDSFNRIRIDSIAVGDFNLDGKLDIYGAGGKSSIEGLIYPMRNLGNNQFAVTAPQNLAYYPIDIAKADFNQDGKVDIVAGSASGSLILYGAANMYFLSAEQRDGTRNAEEKVTVADFNRDGLDDFAAVNGIRSELRVFINSTNGFPTLPQNYQIKPIGFSEINKALINADFNGDNIPDLAIALYRQGKVRIYYGNVNGTFTWGDVVLSGEFPFGLASTDLDSNGKKDLIAADLGFENTDKITTFLNAPNPQRYYADFDADGKSDFTIFRPSTATWWTLFSQNSTYKAQQFGLASDKIVAGNYDGDNKTDIAVYRNGIWYIQQSSNGILRTEVWGQSGDIPVPADYDNDGIMETAVFRPSNGTWYIRNVNSQISGYKWGLDTDKPVPADYDGDGRTDIAVFRPTTGAWYILSSSTNQVLVQSFGLSGDKPVPSDYDGDGKSDVAVFRPSIGFWYISQSSHGLIRIEQFGTSEDIPTQNDYTGDGKSDLVVFRPSSGEWYIKRSQNGSVNLFKWGINQDAPLEQN